MATSKPSRFPRIPYSAIRWLVDKLHVDDPDEMVAGEIASRLERAPRLHSKSCAPQCKACKTATAAEIREARRYALACHEDNRRMFQQVMSGRFGR